MKRRTFMGMAASSMLAVSQKGFAETMFGSKAEDEGLAVRFLGTGAADWNGRDERGELRRLSSILIDQKVLIDCTETAFDMIPPNCHPEVIFYTHSHDDHYQPAAALKLGIKRVYLSQTWYDIACKDFQKAAKELNLPMPVIVPLCIGQPIEVGNLTFTPVPANHATSFIMEQTLLYLVEKGKTRLLYATDTGGIPAVSSRIMGIDAHRNGTPITALIMEATMGMEHEVDFRLFTHSSVALVERTVKVLTQTKRYQPHDGQAVYLTHMARTLHGTQKELDASLPSPLKAAYDGLEVVF